MTIPTTNSAIATAQQLLEHVAGEADLARAIADNDPLAKRIGDRFDKQNIVRTQLITHLWRKIGRQVLAIHPEVVEEVKIANSDKVPGEILRVLPYMNPMVVYADPPTFTSWVAMPKGRGGDSVFTKEASMRLLGFITYGTANVTEFDAQGMARVEQRLYATTDPQATRFGVLLVLEVLDAMGKRIDTEFNNVTIFFNREQTLKELIDELMERYHWNEALTTAGDNGKAARKWMAEVMSVVVGSLFYLCSTTLEAEKVPAKQLSKHMSRQISRKPLSFFKVGWTTGAALTRYRQSRTYSTSEQADISHQQDPQHRRAHFKMQPYGPGMSLRKLIFVSAYWTHIQHACGTRGEHCPPGSPRRGQRRGPRVHPCRAGDRSTVMADQEHNPLEGLTEAMIDAMKPLGDGFKLTNDAAIAQVKKILQAVSLDLPEGSWDAYDFSEDDDPFVRLSMNHIYDFTLYPDGYALSDGGELTPAQAAEDIMGLLSVFCHYQRKELV